jgi:hypothetical protein
LFQIGTLLTKTGNLSLLLTVGKLGLLSCLTQLPLELRDLLP